METYENTLGQKTALSLKLTVLWLVTIVFSLGLLIGPATAAVYKLMFHAWHTNELPTNTVTQFKLSVKLTLKEGISFSLIYGAILAFLVFLYFQASSTAQFVVIYFLGFEVLLLSLYTFPIIAIFKMPSMKAQFKAVFMIGNLHAFSSIALIAMIAIIVTSSILYSPFMLLVLWPLYMLLSSYLYYKVLVFYVADDA